jgi:hypothetical protein
VRVLILSDRCVPPKRGLTAASVLAALGRGADLGSDRSRGLGREEPRFGVVSCSGMLPALMGLRRVRGEVGDAHAARDRARSCSRRPRVAARCGAQPGPVLGT